MQRFFTLAVIGSTFVAGAASANILLNSGFEAGTAGDADSWAELTGPNGSVTRSSASPASGTYSAYIEFDNTGSGTPAAYFIEQNLGANTIDNSLNYNLVFDAKVDSTSFVGQNVFFQILWLDQDGSDGGGVKSETLISLIGEGIDTDYQTFTFNDLDPADGADSFLLRFQLAAGAVADVSNGLYVDNVSLTEVPEPGSLALLALGGLAMIRRRRQG